MAGRVFTVDNAIRTLAYNAFADLIDQLGKPCELVYPPKMEACANCLPDPIGKKSSNRYRNGGPYPFPMGSICPVCGGEGYRAIEISDTVTLLINEDPKSFQSFGNVDIPQGTVQTKGFIANLPKVLKCAYLIKDINIKPYIEYRYKLAGEPLVPANIAPGKIFVANWTRI